MKRLFRPLCCVGALLLYPGESCVAQLLEAPVTLKVDYVPRVSAAESTKTLTTAQVLAMLGFNNGSLVCLAESTDASVPWSLKVKTVQGSKTTYADLSGKLGLIRLGDSLLGAVKGVSSAAPATGVSLGKPHSTQTVKAQIVGATEAFDFYGTLATAYTVTQEAGKKVATWMPGACTAKMAGTHRVLSGENASTASITVVIGAFKAGLSPGSPAGMVRVRGGDWFSTGSSATGVFPNPTGVFSPWQTVYDFQIGKCEVTWGEWKTVRAWAAAHGYTDLANVGAGRGDNYPVTEVNWHDAVKWCNARSEKEGRTPVYLLDGTTYKTGTGLSNLGSVTGGNMVYLSPSANGYRLPTATEWNWAARGGMQTRGYMFSGSNDLNAAGWFLTNSGGAIHEVGKKAANELGIYDMSGNVMEWCESGYSRLNPTGIVTPGTALQGGFWGSFEEACMVGYGSGVGGISYGYSMGVNSRAEVRYASNGFRVALGSIP
jgi:formylglycine-generating enzyme required for sulfatase activity